MIGSVYQVLEPWGRLLRKRSAYSQLQFSGVTKTRVHIPVLTFLFSKRCECSPVQFRVPRGTLEHELNRKHAEHEEMHQEIT